MTKRNLTDRLLKSLKRADPGRRYEHTDVGARGLGIRVNDKALKTWVLIARLPGRKSASRLALGEYPSMTLAEARDKARDWRTLIQKGTDPRVEMERQRLAELRRAGNNFEVVCEDYFADIKRRGLRTAREMELTIRREFVVRWAKRPISEISRHDVLAVLDAAVKRDAPYQAHRLLAYSSALFGFAVERGMIEHSPCDRLRPARIIGTKEPRTRVLEDDELRHLWTASGNTPYPFGPFCRMLLWTGQRKSEVAGARWSEFNLTKKIWTIPMERMKAKSVHSVPLTSEVINLLKSLPRFEGDYVFTTTFGRKPIGGFSKYKARLDRESGIKDWVLHDCRRTMRTALSALPIPDLVRELVIGHTKPGLHKVYDQHAYLDEKRRALELWAKRLRDIVEAPPKNVVSMRRAES